MNDDLVRRVKSNLRAQCYTMNDLWLQGCIEYILTQEPNASDATISTFVTAQWILSDLHDITDGVGSLPPNLSRQNKVVLPKKYILQMMKMYDVSQSKYTQLEKIRKVNTANVEATTNKAESWEPKGKRMIQLFLTDGVQDVIAIEYKPIRKLKDTLLPGFKLMVSGPVTCRKGVILLEEKNYEEVGGEVESLLVTNALENVLARAINLEENPNPYGDETEPQQPPTEFPDDDDFEINFDELNQIERLSLEDTRGSQSSENQTVVTHVENSAPSTTSITKVRSEGSKKKATNNKNKKPSNVEESQSSQNRTAVTRVENSASSTTSITKGRSEESKKKATNDKNKIPSRGIKSYFQITKCEDVLNDNFDDILGAIDVDELQVPETTSSNPECTSKYYSKAPSTNSIASSQRNETNSLVKRQRNNKPSDNVKLKALVTRPHKPEASDDDDVIIVEDYEPEVPEKVDAKKKCKEQSINAINFEDDDILIDDFDLMFDNEIPETKPRILSKNEQENNGPTPKVDNPSNSTRTDVLEPKCLSETTKPGNQLPSASKPKIESQDQRVQSPASGKRPAEDILSPSSRCPPKVMCLDKTTQSNKTNRKITEFTKKLVPKEEPPPKICNFICDVLQQRCPDSTTYETIQGKLSKLNNLTPKGSGWYLEATLTDDTASIDVVFSSQVLEDLIGFSVTEFREKKKLRKTNPEINEFLRKSLRNAEAKLQRMDALIELELKGQGVPTVVKMTQLTEEQRRLIEKRKSILTA